VDTAVSSTRAVSRQHRCLLLPLSGGFAEHENPAAIAKDTTRVARLTRLLREVRIFAPPDGSCLSPVGEYNLRLGVTKELRPDYVATYSMPKPGVHNGPLTLKISTWGFINGRAQRLAALGVGEGVQSHDIARTIGLEKYAVLTTRTNLENNVLRRQDVFRD
jgi:hypothetical protein